MRWPPVTFTVGMLYLSATSAMARSSRGRGHAAPHARHDRVGAVLLDVGVDALVDEARLRIVLIFAGPGAQQVIVERRPAFLAAVRRLPAERLAHRGHGLQFCARIARRTSSWPWSVQPHIGFLVGACASTARRDRRASLDLPGALAARGRGLGVRAHLVERRQALLRDRRDRSCPCETPLQPQICSRRAWRRRRSRAPAPPAASAKARPKISRSRSADDVGLVAHQLDVPGAVGDIAVEHRADEPVVAQDQLLVDAAPWRRAA